jgi:flagellar protein FlbT
MALKLSLKPGEGFIINGAAITNGDKRASLIIQNKANILRKKDIMSPSSADNLPRRLYFVIMCRILGELEERAFLASMTSLVAAFLDTDRSRADLVSLQNVVLLLKQMRLYQALGQCRTLSNFNSIPSSQ